MSFNFPANPTNGQIYSAPNGYQYVYRSDTDSWLGTAPVTETSQPIAGPPGSLGYTGSQGAIGYTGSSGNMIGASGNFINNYPPDFVGPIPADANVAIEFANVDPTSRIVISIYNLNISDNGGLLLQFGTSSGYLTSSIYASSSTIVNGLTNAIATVGTDNGFVINLNSNRLYLNLTITLTRSGANTWVCTHHGTAINGYGELAFTGFNNFSNVFGGGSVNLGSAVIDRLRLVCRTAVPGSVAPGRITTGVCRILYDDAGAIPGDPSSGFVGYTGSAGSVSVPSSRDDIGSYRILTTSSGDGGAFTPGTVLPGSSLRGVGYFTVTSSNGAQFYHTVSANYSLLSLGATNRLPAEGARLIFNNVSPPGSWRSISSIGASTIDYDGSSTASWVNYRTVFLAIRVA